MDTTTQEQLTTALATAFTRFSTLLQSFSDEQINRSPFEGSWTPAQVATHIIKATDGIPDSRTQITDRPIDAMLPMIRPWWEDLNQRFQSPDLLLPDNQTRTKDQLIAELNRVMQRDLAIITQTDLAALCMDFQLPQVGYLTRYEWLNFIEMHLNRHSAQLSRMKSHLATNK
ncbi:MAG TPA: DinB family protein [Chryseosolibacter sp.]